MTVSTGNAVYFDPYDVELNRDPYPMFRRLREEAPLYYNAEHDFYALSRFADVNKALVDYETFSSAREILKPFPEWDVDLANAKLSPTSTVRGWDAMPAGFA